MSTPGAGLEGVVVGDSRLCFIDGEKGILIYCGYDINELAPNSTFEEVCFLLWHDRLPDKGELDALKKELAADRAIPGEVIDILRKLPKGIHPMAALRTAVSALGNFDADVEDMSHEANLHKAVRLTAQMATVLAAFARIRQNLVVIDPVADGSHASNFLRTLNGRDPEAIEARALDVCLILHAEHSYNASTFAARVTASTLADMHSSVVSAIGALKGPLHGGANEQVMRMLMEIGSLDKVDTVIRENCQQGQDPGFGHRVYKTLDPRAVHLKKLSGNLPRFMSASGWTCRRRPRRSCARQAPGSQRGFLQCFYVLQHGHRAGYVHADFAVARISGWTAHIIEQLDNNRLIRPDAYTGKTGLPYIPIERR